MEKKLNILCIGNSFSQSLTGMLEPVVESVPGLAIHLEQASHGGCELYRHWEYISNEERDPVYRMYQDRTVLLSTILQRTPWDFISIQQASHHSWRPETFHPYAENIQDYVAKYAPNAQLVIQQTWAYRFDNPNIVPGGAWGIDQSEMYRRLTENYRNLAQFLGGLPIIPTGYAVQLARGRQAQPYEGYDLELLKSLRWPDVPPQGGSLVGACRWRKNGETGELELARDTIHLNLRGRYLQSCVWCAKLYGCKTSEITYVPEEIADDDARFLREIAQEAVDTF